MLRARVRFSLLDAAVLAAVAAGAAALALSAPDSLDYRWRWEVLPQYFLRRDASGALAPNLLLAGVASTVRLALWTTLLATLAGAAMGLARTARRLLPRLLAGAYVESVRNLPPLVLVFLVYFFLSDQVLAALGVEEWVRGLPPAAQSAIGALLAPPGRLSGFLAALLTLALYEGAYITEMVRAGIQSVDRGQTDAAMALGLTRWQAVRHVVLPQAVRRILPALAGQVISTVKDSAIVAVISVPELTFQALQIMASTGLTFEIWITVMALYFGLCFSASLGARALEARLARAGG
ncbi:MAG: amino acid ABC transporter permease [Thermodesulfobacteriota bacterium]